LYANDAIKESILLQNKNMFEKIKNLEITTLEESIEDPAWGEILIELHSDAIEDISRDIENSQQWNTVNKPLYYYDSGDVSVWCPIIFSLVELLLDGVRSGEVNTFSHTK
jgi:hypothetical protein